MENDSRIATLNEQFSLPGLVMLVAGNGGLAKIQIETRLVAAEIYLHGAQITSWRPAGADEVLFLSAKSHWTDGKAIRGGIPVCFPWFRGKGDDPKAPAHGFVRTKEWQVDSISVAQENAVSVRLSTAGDDASRKWWPFEFRLEYGIAVGKTLTLELRMLNTGDADLKFEEALHTYFRVGDVRAARVRGLEGSTYLDNRDGNREKTQRDELVLTKQTDNAYRTSTGPVEIIDPLLGRRLESSKKNSASTIVWNPWSDGAAGITDFVADEWQSMLCVEGGNILDSAVTLKPGESHTMTVGISVVTDTGR